MRTLSQLHGARWEILGSLLNIDIIRSLHKIVLADLWTRARIITRQNAVDEAALCSLNNITNIKKKRFDSKVHMFAVYLRFGLFVV